MSASPEVRRSDEQQGTAKARLWALLKTALWALVDGLVILAPAGRPTQRALLVRADAIGDFVMWLSEAERLILHLRQNGFEVILVAGSAWAAWAEQMGLADEVISFNRARFDRDLLYRFRLGRQVRGLGCRLAIQPTYSRISHSGDTIVRVSGAKDRIGSTGDPDSDLAWRRRYSDRWFTSLVPVLTGREPVWETEQNINFLQLYLDTKYTPARADLNRSGRLQLPSGFLEDMGDNSYYVLFPGASEAGKRWPVEWFREIAGKIYQETGWHGIVCGAPEDAVLARSLIDASTVPISNWAGRTSLSGLAAILSGGRLLVSNDTSASHIAAAVRTPSVCVLGGGHFGRFHPYPQGVGHLPADPIAAFHQMDCFQCSWRCIYTVPDDAPKPCISHIGVAQVWSVVLGIIAQDRSSLVALKPQQSTIRREDAL